MLPDPISALQTQIYFTVSIRVAERITGRVLLGAGVHGTEPSVSDLQVAQDLFISPVGDPHRN